MAAKRIKEDDENLIKEESYKKYNFNLAEVLIIMIITALCVITITIKVSFKINNTSQKIKTEAELSELINVYNSIKSEYYEKIDNQELISAAIDGMLDSLDDPYTTLLSQTESDNLNKELDGKYVGLGVEIASNSDGTYVIKKVHENSPAKKAGLLESDILLKINDYSVTGKGTSDISNKLKLKEGSTVSVTVKRNEKELSINVQISKVEIQSVSYEIVKSNGKNIAFIKISVFAKNTFEQFKTISSKFKKENIDGIILDLRGNTGGHLIISQSIAELFLNKGDTIYKLSNKKGVQQVKSQKEKIIDLPMVLLVNEQTASASEILTAALKDNLNLDVVGVKTYGKGKVQKVQQLPNGRALKYTIQNWLTPKGEQIDKNGIKPTVEIKQSSKYKDKPVLENDNQYKKALEIISTK